MNHEGPEHTKAVSGRSDRRRESASAKTWPVFAAGLIVLAVIISSTLWLESEIRNRALGDLSNALNTVLKATDKAVHHWVQKKEQEVGLWASHHEVAELCIRAVALHQSGADLTMDPLQEELKEQLGPVVRDYGYLGYRVLSPEGVVLAADGEDYPLIGATGGIPERLLARIKDGANHVGLAFPQKGQAKSTGAASSDKGVIYAAIAVVNDDEEILFVFAFLIDPTNEFTEILQRGRIGNSGESYAFNEGGQLVSESRFDDQLQDIGLVESGLRGILNIEIRDPGGNMVEGFRPEIPLSEQPLTYMANEAIAGRAGENLEGYKDYRGVPVVGAWTWDEIYGFGITTELDVAEAYQSIRLVRKMVFGSTSVTMILILVLTIVFVRSIHRRYQMETRLMDQADAMERQKNMLVNTLESLTHPFYVVDAHDYTIQLANSAARKLGIEELGKAKCHQVTRKSDTPCDSENDPCPLHDMKKTKRPFTVEQVHFDADGNKFYAEVHGYPIFDGEGNVVQVIEYSHDITERKRAQEQLDLRAAALKAAANGIVITDPDGTVQWVNPAFTELTGYGFDEAVGQNPRVLNSGVQDTAFFQEMWQTIKSGAVWIGEVVNRRKDGKLYTEEMTITPVLDEHREIVHFVAIKQNITERKEMEVQLEQARDEAESANRAKSAFLANMSHELRTPMNAIIGYSEMLAEDAEDEGHDDMIPDLNKINASGRHLLALINDILDLSKIEAGRMDLYLESFDLQLMLQESLATLEPLVTKNHNTLETDFAHDLGSIRTDLTKLRQALFNLVSNAAKFTENGTITIAARRTRAEDADTVRIDVTDTGIGIREDKLDQVFEEFGQADDTTTKEYGGTGLGLPISRRFCQMMGGDITLVSEPGVGSTFSIILPSKVDALEVAKASVEAKNVSTVVIDGHDPILIIDDDPNARDLLSRMLTTEGYAVATARDGEEGLALAKSRRPSVITLDVQMPGMDGWSVLKALKSDPELRDIPVIMVSIVDDQKTGYALGAVESLSKPVDREILLHIVARYSSGTKVGTALVVEDDAANRSLLARTLNGAGWKVMQAENGAVGLERLGEQLPDLILLDLMMPVMDGFEFILELRNREECREIPVIVVTAKDLTDEDRFRLTGGVEQIIQKGAFSREKFLRDVSNLIEQHGIKKDEENGTGRNGGSETKGETK